MGQVSSMVCVEIDPLNLYGLMIENEDYYKAVGEGMKEEEEEEEAINVQMPYPFSLRARIVLSFILVS